MSSADWVVVKFGGTSVSSLSRWQSIVKVLTHHRQAGRKVLLVCSAPARVSNLLDQALSQALSGSPGESIAAIIAIYEQLAVELALDAKQLLGNYFNELQRLLDGIHLLRESSYRVQAQVMAFGELMLTRLGEAFLQQSLAEVGWLDAREALITELTPLGQEALHYLSARGVADYRQELVQQLSVLPHSVVITQGFIARDHKGDTVLLGRGGSDVSAALFAANIKAERCEIWTDVPGIYTANPHLIPQARLLKRLDYDEAQEIASMGGKVLHPNCIRPLKNHGIPLWVKFTSDPEREGTLVSSETDGQAVQIKSIISKMNILLISIETTRMWHQVGFLADVFLPFKQHGLSVDLISTSETSITVSLDNNSKPYEQATIDALLKDLSPFCRTQLIGPCASISLIGHNIRSILHQLGEIFEVFEAQKVHLMTQAANDLNLTFVVDEDQAERISKKLHHLCIDQDPTHYYFSQSWQEEFGEKVEPPAHWWQAKRESLLKLAQQSAPLYVYDQATLDDAVAKVKQCSAVDQVFYAMKANSHRDILRHFYQRGLNFECVSLGEVDLILELFPDISRQRILFTPNFAPRQEYATALELGIYVTVDNIYPLAEWGELFHQREIIVRIDPVHGAGHHRYVTTAGASSKFGVPLDQVDELLTLTEKHDIKVIGLHAHTGSGILQPGIWQQTSLLLTSLLDRFPEVRIINVGGGLGIVERPGQQALDLAEVNQLLLQAKQTFSHCQLWIEPGRFLVARSGVILARVTQTKRKDSLVYVGVETGMNSLIRPALYGSYHEIVNLTRLDSPRTQLVNIVGPICETGDTLGYSRLLPQTFENDVLLIANAGAYGYCMSSRYNLREPASEVVLC